MKLFNIFIYFFYFIYLHRINFFSIESKKILESSFSILDAIEKLGIERRLLFSGESKALMDPFLPLDFFEEKHMQKILDKIHQQFISVVKDGRGKSLDNQYEEELFSGLIWSGEESVKLGLVDGLASTSEVARDIIGNEHIINYTKRDNYFDRFAKQIGSSLFYNFKRSTITQ